MTERYDVQPTYQAADGEVRPGYPSTDLPGGTVLAVDGPPAVDWETLIGDLGDEFRGPGSTPGVTDLRDHVRPWPEVLALTGASELPGDDHFARLSRTPLRSLLDVPGRPPVPRDGVHLVVGPGAALVPHDRLWYADVPRNDQLARLRRGGAGNLGQPDGQTGDEQRLQFIDWPVLDRHRADHLDRLDAFVDVGDPDRPAWIGGDALRATIADLAARPFRTRPHFHPGVWGGQWLARTFELDDGHPNLAWSYELIAPEAGVLVGNEVTVEVPLQVLLDREAQRVLGPRDAERFGASFPIRFDYLDTWEGQPLSVHCHPREDYMREVFGWPYTQHETYYVMDSLGGRDIFLGLLEEADLADFRAGAETARDRGEPFDIFRHVRRFPARPHQLYLVPAGTPHGSGEGNVVLEISATPYAYSLRFYDWLRTDLDGRQRPVHLDHAFANVTASRRGAAVDDLVPEPVTLRRGAGWCEELLGSLPELFFEVRRLRFADTMDDATNDGCHVLNLVAGEAIDIETASGVLHPLRYGETILLPAAVGGYRLTSRGEGEAMVVKAQVAEPG